MAHNTSKIVLLILFVSFCFFSYSSASSSAYSSPSCSNHVFTNGQTYKSCINLSTLNSFIHWNFDVTSRILQIAYRHINITPSTWVAWGLNPQSKGMIGTQALVAYQKSDGNMRVYSTPISSYGTKMLPGDLTFNVSNLSASYSDGEIVIFASLKLPNNYTMVNQVWQDGPVSNDLPGMHRLAGPSVQSMATIDILQGQYAKTSTGKSVNARMKGRINHGIINTISWGMMMPLGAVIARYMKVFKSADPAWFYLHIFCQISGFIIGTAGFTTGILLGNFSNGIVYTIHRIVGIILMSLASFQVILALFFRPKKDHKYRIWWNACHYLIGYLVMGLSIFNIFRGFGILKPRKVWENAYIGYILGLASIVVVLEIYTWIIVLKRRYLKATEDSASSTNGENLA